MTYLTGVDPGEATGIVLGYYDERTPWERVDFWLVRGGVEGFMDWYWTIASPKALGAQFLSEKFILRAQDFVANTEPLRIEGAMIALGLNPIWQDRTQKALCKDSVLRANGLWVTGSMCNHTDGRDVMDAEIHSLARMKKIKHLPSLRKYWG